MHWELAICGLEGSVEFWVPPSPQASSEGGMLGFPTFFQRGGSALYHEAEHAQTATHFSKSNSISLANGDNSFWQLAALHSLCSVLVWICHFFLCVLMCFGQRLERLSQGLLAKYYLKLEMPRRFLLWLHQPVLIPSSLWLWDFPGHRVWLAAQAALPFGGLICSSTFSIWYLITLKPLSLVLSSHLNCHPLFSDSKIFLLVYSTEFSCP